MQVAILSIHVVNCSTDEVHHLRYVSGYSLFAHQRMLVDLLSVRDKHRPETLKLRSLASDEVPRTTLTTPLQSGADTRGSGPEQGQECIQDKRGGRDVVQALQRDSTISLSPNSHDPTKVNGVQIAQPFWRKAGVMRRSLKTLMNLMPERLGTSLGTDIGGQQ